MSGRHGLSEPLYPEPGRFENRRDYPQGYSAGCSRRECIEVFWIQGEPRFTPDDGGEWRGWYWWITDQGLPPIAEPYGPYHKKAEAKAAALETFGPA